MGKAESEMGTNVEPAVSSVEVLPRAAAEAAEAEAPD
jgi:hypothetical protein